MFTRVRSGLLAACLALAPLSAYAQEQIAYTLRPGDKVSLEVFTSAGDKLDVVAGERTLDREGDIYLPYVGTLHAAGLDQNSLREVLVTRYGGYYAEPVVNVKVMLRVNVTGSVGRPGQYFLDPTATLLDALTAAGSANVEFAVNSMQIPGDPRHVQLVRDGVRTTLNFHPDEVAPDVMNMRIASGDWIYVPPENRTAVRDEILFWGSLISLASSTISLIILLGR